MEEGELGDGKQTVWGVVVDVGGVTPENAFWEVGFWLEVVMGELLVSVVEEGGVGFVGDVVDVLRAGVSGLMYRVLMR